MEFEWFQRFRRFRMVKIPVNGAFVEPRCFYSVLMSNWVWKQKSSARRIIDGGQSLTLLLHKLRLKEPTSAAEITSNVRGMCNKSSIESMKLFCTQTFYNWIFAAWNQFVVNHSLQLTISYYAATSAWVSIPAVRWRMQLLPNSVTSSAPLWTTNKNWAENSRHLATSTIIKIYVFGAINQANVPMYEDHV